MAFISTTLKTPITHSCSDVVVNNNYEFLSSVEYNLARDNIPGPLDDLLNYHTRDGEKYLLSTAHWSIAPFSKDPSTSVVCHPDSTGQRIYYTPGLIDNFQHPAETLNTEKKDNKDLWEYTTLAQLTSSLHEFTITPSTPRDVPKDVLKWDADTRVYGLAIGTGYNVHYGAYDDKKPCLYSSLYICSPVIDHATGDINHVVLGILIKPYDRDYDPRHMTTVYADEPKPRGDYIYVYEVGGLPGIGDYSPTDEEKRTFTPFLTWEGIKFKWEVTEKWIDGRRVSILVPYQHKNVLPSPNHYGWNKLEIPQDDPHIPFYLKKDNSKAKYVTPMIRPHVCNGFFYGSMYPSPEDKIYYSDIFYSTEPDYTSNPELCDFHGAWSWGFQVRNSGSTIDVQDHLNVRNLVSLRGPLRGAIGFCEGSFPLPIPNHGCEIVGGLDSCCGLHLDGVEEWFNLPWSLSATLFKRIVEPYMNAEDMIAQPFSRVVPVSGKEFKFMPNALHRDCLYSSVVELDENLWIAPESLLEKDGVYKEKVPWTVLSYTQDTGELMVGDVIDTSCLGAEIFMGTPRYWSAQKIGDSYWVWSSRIPVDGETPPEITVHKLEWKAHKMYIPDCQKTNSMLQYIPDTDLLSIH